MIEGFINAIQRLFSARTPDELIDDLLYDHEYVELVDGPAPQAFLFRRLGRIFVSAVLLLAAFWLNNSWITMAVVFFVLLVVIQLLVDAVQDHYKRYVMTNVRVIHLHGVVNRRYEWMPWSKVTDISFVQSLLDRVLGVSRVRIESANEASAFAEMTDLTNPKAFMEKLVENSWERQYPVEARKMREARIQRWAERMAETTPLSADQLTEEELAMLEQDDND